MLMNMKFKNNQPIPLLTILTAVLKEIYEENKQNADFSKMVEETNDR